MSDNVNAAIGQHARQVARLDFHQDDRTIAHRDRALRKAQTLRDHARIDQLHCAPLLPAAAR
jgi:hypothetical protein